MKRMLLVTAALAGVLGIMACLLSTDSTEAARPAFVFVLAGWEHEPCDDEDVFARNIQWGKAGGTRYVVIHIERTSPPDAESQEEEIRFDKPRRQGRLDELKLTRPSGFADGEGWSAWVELRNTGGKTIAVSNPWVFESCSPG